MTSRLCLVPHAAWSLGFCPSCLSHASCPAEHVNWLIHRCAWQPEGVHSWSIIALAVTQAHVAAGSAPEMCIAPNSHLSNGFRSLFWEAVPRQMGLRHGQEAFGHRGAVQQHLEQGLTRLECLTPIQLAVFLFSRLQVVECRPGRSVPLRIPAHAS